MSEETNYDDNSLVYYEAHSHRWGFDADGTRFRLAWQEGTPKFTFGMLDSRPIYIPIESIHNLADALDELAEMLEKKG